MYPKVKVRGEEEEEQEDSVTLQEERSSLLLRIFESISLQSYSPGNEDCKISPRHPRIPKSYAPNEPVPFVATSKDNTHRSTWKNNKEADDESRTHIRASPVPRPRAVLSSPDNDEMIGSRNRLPRERDLISKTRNVGQNALVQGNRILKNVNTVSPISTRVSKGSSVIHPKEKFAKNLTVPRQKSSPRKGKASIGGL